MPLSGAEYGLTGQAYVSRDSLPASRDYFSYETQSIAPSAEIKYGSGMDAHTIPCLGGPLCGEDKPYHPSGWLIEVTEYAAHRYILAQDSDGSRYWSWSGTVPLATPRAA